MLILGYFENISLDTGGGSKSINSLPRVTLLRLMLHKELNMLSLKGLILNYAEDRAYGRTWLLAQSGENYLWCGDLRLLNRFFNNFSTF